MGDSDSKEASEKPYGNKDPIAIRLDFIMLTNKLSNMLMVWCFLLTILLICGCTIIFPVYSVGVLFMNWYLIGFAILYVIVAIVISKMKSKQLKEFTIIVETFKEKNGYILDQLDDEIEAIQEAIKNE